MGLLNYPDGNLTIFSFDYHNALMKIKEDFGLENYQHVDAFGKMLGYKISKIDRKKNIAILELKITKKHLSPANRVHGGVISSFFDYACGAAVFTTLGPKDFCSTVELKVNYFKPLDSGDRLIAEARVVFRGKRLCVVHSMVRRAEEKNPVAMATATFNVVLS